jgi:hypothetical protein
LPAPASGSRRSRSFHPRAWAGASRPFSTPSLPGWAARATGARCARPRRPVAPGSLTDSVALTFTELGGFPGSCVCGGLIYRALSSPGVLRTRGSCPANQLPTAFQFPRETDFRPFEANPTPYQTRSVVAILRNRAGKMERVALGSPAKDVSLNFCNLMAR